MVPGRMNHAGKTSRPLILSASRRTDLPGFHGPTCAALIRRRIAGLRTRHLYGVVFWSRHGAPFLSGGPLHDLVAKELANPLLHLTVTGQGAGPLEPGVPSTDHILRLLPALVRAFHGDPRRIRWRFDPLLRGISSIGEFEHIGSAMADNGITTCTFSFPAKFSLKGPLSEIYAKAGIENWRPDEQKDFLKRLCDAADRLGIALLSCAQPENARAPLSPLSDDGYPRIAQSACIDGALLEQLHPVHEPLLLGRDRSQRRHCRCIESEDIGDYVGHLCGGGCAYCYSKAGGPLNSTARDIPLVRGPGPRG
jgi:hypothetical protein